MSRTRVYLAHVAYVSDRQKIVKPDLENRGSVAPFLFRQLELLAGNKLKAIICLGLTAARTLIPNGPDGKRLTRLSDIRGQWHEWRELFLLCLPGILVIYSGTRHIEVRLG